MTPDPEFDDRPRAGDLHHAEKVWDNHVREVNPGKDYRGVLRDPRNPSRYVDRSFLSIIDSGAGGPEYEHDIILATVSRSGVLLTAVRYDILPSILDRSVAIEERTHPEGGQERLREDLYDHSVEYAIRDLLAGKYRAEYTATGVHLA